MKDENSIKLVLTLEERLGQLIREYKHTKQQVQQLSREIEQLRNENLALEQALQQLKEENKELLLKNITDTSASGKELIQYLDEVISLLDRNIEQL